MQTLNAIRDRSTWEVALQFWGVDAELKVDLVWWVYVCIKPSSGLDAVDICLDEHEHIQMN